MTKVLMMAGAVILTVLGAYVRGWVPWQDETDQDRYPARPTGEPSPRIGDESPG